MADETRLKPHHLVDIVMAVGAGQEQFLPHPYGHALHTVARRVLDDRETVLRVELGADDICQPCRHNIHGKCDDGIDTSWRPRAPSSKRLWNLRLDRRWCRRLGLKRGSRLTVAEFLQLLRQRAGDLADIYREMPADRVAVRAEHLRRGLDRLLRCAGGPRGVTSHAEGRFVILAHSGYGPLHYDLLLEQEGAQGLATWQLPRSPGELAAGEAMPARRLNDHRREYLAYEGPVSRGRGSVDRVDEGAYELVVAEAARREVVLRGRQVVGRFELLECGSEADEWTLTRL